MPNTFSQCYYHIVFSVKYREPLIDPAWEKRLFGYISGIIKSVNQSLVAVNGMPDHLHLLVRLSPAISPSDFVREIKKQSQKWINSSHLCQKSFRWQTSYGIFTVSHLSVEPVRSYINNQKAHHSKTSFREEFIKLLEENDLKIDLQYLP